MSERTLLWNCCQFGARSITSLLFDLRVQGQEYIPPTGGVLIVSNHQSCLDPVVLGAQLQRPLDYIAKSELFQNRLAARILRSLNAFPVHQGHADVSAVKETIHRLQEGHLLNIYPEGARTEDGEIARLQRGVALIVKRAKVAVIPAVIDGAFEAWPIHRKLFRPYPIRIRFGPPMTLADKEPGEIIAIIDHTLRSMFNEFRTRHAA